MLPSHIDMMWPYYIAIASVFATALYMRIESQRAPRDAATKPPAPERSTVSVPAKEEIDEAEPSALIKAHALSGYAYLIARGKVLDLIEKIVALVFFWRTSSVGTSSGPSLKPSGPRVGPPIWTGWQIFYTKRLYQRIVDCWNRPIAGQASSSIDVCDRQRVGTGDAAALEMKGTTTRCLNLGSYNYLGFGGWEEHVSPAVVATLRTHGVSGCSPRMECGNTRVHTALEETVAQYLDKEAALVVGMGFATNSTLIPVRQPIEGPVFRLTREPALLAPSAPLSMPGMRSRATCSAPALGLAPAHHSRYFLPLRCWSTPTETIRVDRCGCPSCTDSRPVARVSQL